MRVLKLVFNAFVLFVLLPVVIAVVLGVVFAPLQTSARAVEPRVVLEASDIMWVAALASETVQESESESGPESEPTSEPESEPMLELETSEDAFVDLDPLAEVVGQPAVSEERSEADDQGYYSAEQFRTQGVIIDGDYRYTWYSQRVLPGGGLDIEGRHVSDDGYVVDAQNRIVVASSDLPRGTELAVPFGGGRAVVLDTGCASGTLDVYTDF